MPQELEVLSLSHLYSLDAKPKAHNVITSDIMRVSVIGIKSDIRIKLQAPVDMHALTFMRKWIFQFLFLFFFKSNFVDYF